MTACVIDDPGNQRKIRIAKEGSNSTVVWNPWSDKAKAMLERAVTELKADEAKALAKFNAGSDGFKDRDLYVFCFDAATGMFTAHPTLMGKDIRTLKDKSGTAFGEQIFNAAKEGAINTVDYMFPRPGGTDPVPKQSFVTRVGKQGCGVGYYKT